MPKRCLGFSFGGSGAKMSPFRGGARPAMLFKMILDAARDDERAIARGFLRHIVVGIGAGFALGSVVLVALFLIFAKLDLHVPVIFMAAAIVQFGPIGGLIGAGIHLSRITDRSAPEEKNSSSAVLCSSPL